jgi:alpha-ketoglutarate-dependent taurine dioxygenase
LAVAALSKHVAINTLPRTKYDTFRVRPISPHIGAEVKGVDLSKQLSAGQLSDIRAAWAEWMVLVFRDLHLDREVHKALGRHFGRLHTHPMNHGRSGQVIELLPQGSPQGLFAKARFAARSANMRYAAR